MYNECKTILENLRLAPTGWKLFVVNGVRNGFEWGF